MAIRENRKTITPADGEFEFPGEHGYRFDNVRHDEHDPSHDLDPTDDGDPEQLDEKFARFL